LTKNVKRTSKNSHGKNKKAKTMEFILRCNVFLRNLKEKVQWEDLGVYVTIILKWIFKKWEEGLDCVDLVQNRDSWKAL